MKRKVIWNGVLGVMLLALGLTACDQRNDEDRFQAEIRYFILEHLEDDIAYNPIRFQRIDNNFLSSDVELMTSVLAIQDTVRTKMNLALGNAVVFESPVIKAFLGMENDFEIDLIDELILENIKLDNALKSKLDHKPLPENYRAQQQLFTDQLFDINNALSHFNLSAYHIDLSGKASTFYLHQYQLNQAQSITTIFELNTESLEVLSFKDII
ncbi:hypothetical protein [Roseivirga sp.]|uniref:hypothetical protein n=1 Tax=Roseivirga sp. TaxID=1964215 RepID=UPI002B270F71|nr:hypothetical protein [Roseivirga sp.]